MKVRVAVAVGDGGDYHAVGWSDADPTDCMGIAADCLESAYYAEFWLEADLPIPVAQTVKAKVEEVTSGD